MKRVILILSVMVGLGDCIAGNQRAMGGEAAPAATRSKGTGSKGTMTFYKDTETGLRFDRPKDWVARDTIYRNAVGFAEAFPSGGGGSTSGARAMLEVRMVETPDAARLYMEARADATLLLDRWVKVDGAPARMTARLLPRKDPTEAPAEWLFVDGVKGSRSLLLVMSFPSDQQEKYLKLIEGIMPSIRYGVPDAAEIAAEEQAARTKARELAFKLEDANEILTRLSRRYGEHHPYRVKAQEEVDRIKAESVEYQNVRWREPISGELPPGPTAKPGQVERIVLEPIARALTPTQIGMFDPLVREVLSFRRQSMGAVKKAEVECGVDSPLAVHERGILKTLEKRLEWATKSARLGLVLRAHLWPMKPADGVDAQTLAVEEIAKLDEGMAERVQVRERLLARREQTKAKVGEKHLAFKAVEAAIEDVEEDIAAYAKEWRDLQGRLY